jgi:hypothetical protein
MLAPDRPGLVGGREEVRLVESPELDLDLVRRIPVEHLGAAGGQKQRSPSGVADQLLISPLIVTRSAAKIAKALKALPLSLRQVMQWHRPTRFGSPQASKVSCPQAQPPLNTRVCGMSGIAGDS